MSSAASSSAGSWTRVIPTELPRRAGLTIRRGSDAASGEGDAARSRTAAGSLAQRAAWTSRQSTTGRPDPAAQPLEDDLVHADRRGGHARPGVGESGGLEQRLDRAVLAERAVEGDERRPARVAPLRAGRWRPRPRPGRPRRAMPGRRRRSRAGHRGGARSGSHHQPPSRSMRTCSTEWPSAARASAMAVPDTIETSCSADGPPRSTTTGGLPLTPRPPSRDQSPTNSISKARSTPCRARTSARTRSARRRTSAAWPFWSLTMKFACFSETTAPPMRSPFRPAASISRPAESPGGLRKTLPADGSPSGWCACRQRRMSSSRALIGVRVGLLEAERRRRRTTSRGASATASWSARLNRLSR